MSRMPAQKPHHSKQDYGTPRELIHAVEARWGKLDCDLAATKKNAKAWSYLTRKEDALSYASWDGLGDRLWLNPPFTNIRDWAVLATRTLGRWGQVRNTKSRLFMLTPASVGSDWFASYVHRRALVLALRPRITFEGEEDPFPKDCILSVYGETPDFDVWRWNAGEYTERRMRRSHLVTQAWFR